MASASLPLKTFMAQDPPKPEVENAAPGKALSPAARRALEEAAQRRAEAIAESVHNAPPQDGGPKGPEPTRFGDWERKGVAVDF